MGIFFKAALVILAISGIITLALGIRSYRKERHKSGASAKTIACLMAGAVLLTLFLSGAGVFLYFLSSDFEKRQVFKGELQQEKPGRYFNQNKGKMRQQ